MSTKAKTIQEIFSELNHKDIAESAENRFRSKEVSRRRFSQKLANMIPVFAVIVWLVAYTLSAPHTSTLFMRITPKIIIDLGIFAFEFSFIIGNVAPLAIEGGVALLSGLVEYGQKQWRLLLWLILLLSVSVNIVGGLVSLDEYFASNQNITHLQLAWQVVSVFAGIIVSMVSYATGKIIVMFATDKIDLEIETGKQWFGIIKYYALREAFYNAALKSGASPSRATKYAEKQAIEYCAGEVEIYDDGTVQAIATPMEYEGVMKGSLAKVGTVYGQSKTVQAVQSDFGFAGMAKGNIQILNSGQSKTSTDSVHVPILSKMTKKNVRSWLRENPDGWQQWITTDTKREKAQQISLALSGSARGYKTVERAFSEMGIEL